MNPSAQATVAASQAALTLAFGTKGSADNRYSLDRDALIIGKSRSCDLVLEAPDISTLHCIITRNAGGYSIRDCDSRSGTKLNGDRVKEATLHDGDLVQLGPFSFRMSLPPKRAGGSNRDIPARLIRLERKRLNLARLALSLRRRLHQPPPPMAQPAGPDLESSQLLAQGELLTQRLRDCEQRAANLDQAERALADDRAALSRDLEEFQQWEDLKEHDLKQRKQELEQQYAARQEELERDWARQRESSANELTQLQAEMQAQAQPRQGEPQEQDHQREQALQQKFHQREQELELQFRQREQELEQQFRKRLDDLEQQSRQQRQELEEQFRSRQSDWDGEQESRRQQLERELAARLAQADQRQQQLEKEFNDRQRQLQHDFEQWRGNLAQQLSRPDQAEPLGQLPSLDDETEEDLENTMMLPMVNGVLERTNWLNAEEEEEARRLLIRRRELEFFSQHLRRTRDRLGHQPRKTDQSPDREPPENHMKSSQAPASRESWTPEQTAEILKRQQAALERTESVLEEQRTAMADMLAEFRRLQSAPAAAPAVPTLDPDLESLVEENDQLRRLLEEQAKASSAAPAALENHREVEQLRADVDLLQKLLDEKDLELRQARQQGSSSVADMPAVEDVDSYEAELVQFRRQLEEERAKLSHEMEQLRVRNQELDEATREMEMEMSRERAEMGRERIRLDRMREEIQADLERLQRNGSVMERLAPVKKLREEIVENRQKPPVTTPPPGKSDPNMLGSFRNGRRN